MMLRPNSSLTERAGQMIGPFGRTLRPARSIPRGPEGVIAWQGTLRGLSLAGRKPNGKCRLIAGQRIDFDKGRAPGVGPTCAQR